MSIFTKQAHESTKGRGAYDANEQQRELDEAAAQAAAQYGKGGYQGSTSADRATQDQAYQISDTARREAASPQRNTLATAEDTRKNQVGDIVGDALDSQTQAEIAAIREQKNQDTSSAFDTKNIQKDTSNSMRDITLKENQSAVTRSDAIEELYRKGRAEDALFAEALAGKLKMQDIDIYYNQMNSDLDNTFKLWESGQKIEFDKAMSELQTKAQNMGMTLTGIIQLVMTLLK
jgi:hypothetical protein